MSGGRRLGLPPWAESFVIWLLAATLTPGVGWLAARTVTHGERIVKLEEKADARLRELNAIHAKLDQLLVGQLEAAKAQGREEGRHEAAREALP